MTKKDYIVIAKAIKDMDATIAQKEKLVAALVFAMQGDNSRFDAQRFANACFG